MDENGDSLAFFVTDFAISETTELGNCSTDVLK